MNDSALPKLITDYIHNVLPHMEGWCTPAKAEALALAVLDHKPEVIVEIGVFAGRSLIALALAAHVTDKGRIIGIDPWDKDASIQGFAPADPNHKWWRNDVNHDFIYGQCVTFMKQLGVSGRVTLCRGTSEHSLPGFHTCQELLGRPFIGFLHIDGNHSEMISCFDVEAYVPLVEPGGIVVFDDVNWGTTKRAQELLADLCDFQFFVETEGQKCAFYKKK